MGRKEWAEKLLLSELRVSHWERYREVVKPELLEESIL